MLLTGGNLLLTVECERVLVLLHDSTLVDQALHLRRYPRLIGNLLLQRKSGRR